ncbi:MAG: biopolymer transport protein ExbD [Bradymonadia bacterium]
MNFHRSKQRRPAELDLTPLIDVVFLLLIFFLVTATTATADQSVIPVDLPSGPSGEQSGEDEQVTLTVEGVGRFVLQRGGNAELIEGDLEDVRAALERIHAELPDRAVFLRGDRNVPYGVVMEALDVARTIGFPRVYNVVERPR